MWQFFKFSNGKNLGNPSLWENFLVKSKSTSLSLHLFVIFLNYFPELEILKLAYKNCLSIDDGLKFDSSEACKGKIDRNCILLPKLF
jgi:hypothetical protein